VNLGTYLTGLTMGDFGLTPSAGIFSVTDTATSTSDTSVNFLVGTGPSSRHNSFAAQLNNINQLQICWQPGPQGETVIGSAVACPAINQSPFAKFVAMSATGAHTVERLYQQSSAATGTMLEMNNATAMGTGFNFWKACAGATGGDTGCGSGANVASLRGDGYLTAAGANFTGGVTLPITGSGSQCLHVSSTGVVSGTGSDCGAGTGGSGTVNSGTAYQVAMYSGTGTVVSGDAALTDNGTTLSYSGNASIGGSLSTSGNASIGGSLTTGALTGTSANFTGNVTVGGQLIATGPWAVSGPAPGLVITPLAGTSQAAFDANGILSVSENGGGVVQIAKMNSNISGTAANLSGTPTLPSGTVVPGYVPTATAVNGHALSANVVVSASDLTTGLLPHAQLPALVSGDIPNNAASTTGTAANLSGTPALPNGTTATTQSAADSSMKLSTTAFAHSMVPADTTASPWFTAIHNGAPVASEFSASSYRASLYGVVLPFQKTTTSISYNVSTADTTNTGSNYDIGIYTGASGGTCTLVAHTGPIPASTSMTAGWHRGVSWTGGSVTLQPGRYYIGLTSAATSNTAWIAGDSSGLSFASGVGNTTVTAGGTLDSSVTCPTDLITASTLPGMAMN